MSMAKSKSGNLVTFYLLDTFFDSFFPDQDTYRRRKDTLLENKSQTAKEILNRCEKQWPTPKQGSSVEKRN